MTSSSRPHRKFNAALVGLCGIGSAFALLVDYRISVLWAAVGILVLLGPGRQIDETQGTSRYGQLLYAAPIALLPTAIGAVNARPWLLPVPLILFFGVFLLISGQTIRRLSTPALTVSLPVGVLVIISLAAIARGPGLPTVDPMATLLNLLLVLVSGVWAASHLDARRQLLALRAGLTLFFSVNLALLLFGIQSQEALAYLDGAPPGENWLGFQRAILPLANGVNIVGIAAASLVVLAVALHGSISSPPSGLERAWLLADVAMTAAVLAIIGARIALVTGLGIAVLLVFMRAAIPRFVFPSALLITVPVWWNTLVESLGLPQSGLTSLNHRSVIWERAMASFFEADVSELVFGFGSYGHLTSGASQSWDHLFAAWSHPTHSSPHNSFLQLWFDGGLISVALAAASLMVVAGRLRHAPDTISIPVSAVLVVLFVTSAFESSLIWTYQSNTAGMVLLITILLISSNQRNDGPLPRLPEP